VLERLETDNHVEGSWREGNVHAWTPWIGRSAPRELSSETLTAGDVYRALWRHKFFIVVLTAVFVGATWYVTSRQTRMYEASTLVRVQERGPNAGTASTALLASQTLTQTYAKIIDSGALKGEIKRLIGRCSNPDSGRAQSAAPRRTGNSVSPTNARSPGSSSCGWLGGTSRGRVSLLKFSEANLSASPVEDLDLLSITARSKNPTRAMVVATAAPLVLRTFIRRTGSRSEQIVIAKAATIPRSPVSRQLPLKIAIALMVGLIFNGALALLIELFRDRLPEPGELGQAVGHPVLAAIPTLRLHRVEAVVGTREETNSVLSVGQSLDGEGSPRATAPRVGPEP
jgi:capsular polysaccharide biosynthesis protein